MWPNKNTDGSIIEYNEDGEQRALSMGISLANGNGFSPNPTDGVKETNVLATFNDKILTGNQHLFDG